MYNQLFYKVETAKNLRLLRAWSINKKGGTVEDLFFLGFWFSLSFWFWFRFRSCLNGFHRRFATHQLDCFTAARVLNYNDKSAVFALVFVTFLFYQKLTPTLEC